jgi:hypothetical protein
VEEKKLWRSEIIEDSKTKIVLKHSIYSILNLTCFSEYKSDSFLFPSKLFFSQNSSWFVMYIMYAKKTFFKNFLHNETNKID